MFINFIDSKASQLQNTYNIIVYIALYIASSPSKSNTTN